MKIFNLFKRKNDNATGFSSLERGALLAAKPKRTLLTILAAALCCVCMVATGLGISAINASAATDSSTYICLNDGTNSSWGTTYKNGITALFRRLGGTGVTTYSQLLSLIDSGTSYKTISGTKYNCRTAGGIRSYGNNTAGYNGSDSSTSASGGNVRVKFGGYDWLVAMVSKVDRTTNGTSSANGHLIATLILADSTSTTMNFATYKKGGSTNAYPSNLYDISYVRSYLTGSKYSTSGTTAPSSNYTGSPFQTFTNTYKDYLVQPKYVGWQEYENSAYDAGYNYTCSGCSYNKSPYSASWKSSTYNMTSHSYYGSWKEDYIWLPSASEIGGRTESHGGIWGTDANFRKATTKYWTRSANSIAINMMYISTTGLYDSDGASAGSALALRPCIHLDLYALNARTTDTTTVTSTAPYWSTSQSNFYRYNSQILYGSYTGAEQTATLYQPSDVTYKSETGYSSPSSLNGTTRTYYKTDVTLDTSAYSQGENYDYAYTYFRPTTSSQYFPDGTWYNYLTIKMYRAVLTLGLDSTKLTYNGTAKAPTINSITAKSASASRVSKTVSSSYLPTTSNFIIYYYGTKADGTTWKTASSNTTTKPTEVGQYYMRVRLSSEDKWRTNFTLNESYAAPTYATSTDTYQKDYYFEITYGDITTYSATALNGTYNGTAQNLITAYSATTQTTQTWTFSTTSSTSGFSSTIPTRTDYTSGITVWCKVTAPYYNDRVFYVTAKIAKKSISTGVTWSDWGTYTYNGSAHTPTPTITAVGSNSVTSSSTSDFEYSYTNNVNAGTATVTISAKSTSTNYTGSVSRNFTINKSNVTSPTWWGSQGMGVTRVDSTHCTATYSGAQTYAEVTTRDSTYITWTVSSTDISWNSTSTDRMYFTNAGNYTVTAQLKDSANYRWSDYATNSNTNRYLYLNVAKKDISSGVTWSSIGPYTYDGGDDIEPYPVITAVGSNSVTTTTSEFSYSWSDNCNVGTGTVTVTAKTTSKNFTGTADRTFTITRRIVDAVYWLDEQEDGITKSGKTLTTTYNNTERTFKAYEDSSAPSPSNSSGLTTNWDRATEERTLYATNAGTYTITWSIDSANEQWSDGTTANIVLTIVINKASISSYSQGSKTYTGSPVTFEPDRIAISPEITNAPTMDQLLSYSYYGTANDGTTYASSGSPSATAPTKAGTYYCVRTLKSAYANNYSYGSTGVVSVSYTINRATITATWSNYNLGYTGAAQFPTFSISVPTTVISSARPTTGNFTFSGTGTEVGTYTRTATLATSYAYNFQLSGSTCTSISNSAYTNTYCTRNFTIGEVIVELPYWLELDGYTISTDKLTATTTFNNTSLTFRAFEADNSPAADYDFTVDAYTWDDDTRTISITNAGTYKFVYALDDPDNQKWADGTTSDITLTIKISKAKVKTLESSGYSDLVYNGKAQGPDVNKVTYETEVKNPLEPGALFATKYTGTPNGSTANSYNSTAKPTVAGTYRANYSVADAHKDNYEADGYYCDFTISKRDLSDEAVSFSTISAYTYDGNSKTPKPIVTAIGENSVSTTSGIFSYTYANNVNAGTATVTVTAPAGAVNYTGSSEREFTINKAVITGVTWDKVVFTYNGEEQCPAISGLTTKTTVNASAKPITMFEVTGGQVNAGMHTATATLKEDYAKNFTTSSTDTEATQYKTAYTIEKAYLELTFGTLEFTYSGLSQQPEFTLNTNSGKDVKDGLQVDVMTRGASYLTNGRSVDAGSYKIQVSMFGDVALNYEKHLNGAVVADGTWTADYEIAVCKLQVEWTETEYDYNGAKQGTTVASFTGKPEHGADPYKGLIVTYYGVNGALTAMPVHAGEYSVKVALANRNYVLVDDEDNGLTAAEQEFKINSVSFEGNEGELDWSQYEELIFTGLEQGPELNGEYKGLFTADGGRTLYLTVTYAPVDAEGNAGEFVTEKFVNAGKYIARVTESYGDYTFEDKAFEIETRKVIVEWHGDSLSRLDVDTYKWLYDGEKHAPGYTVKFVGEGDDEVIIYRDGEQTDVLEIKYGSLTNAGKMTLTAELSNDEYNKNFEIVTESKTQKIEVEQFIATKVYWYELGAEEALTDEQLASLRYEYSKVNGINGPKLTAKATATFLTDESGTITREITLKVNYPTYFDGYWKISDTPYKAIAVFNGSDSAYCEFADGLLKDDNGEMRVFVTFLVTDLRTDLEKLTIIWVVDLGGVETDVNDVGEFDRELGYGWLNGEFTFVYNGEAQYPVPRATGEYNNRVSVSVGDSGKHINVGTGYTVYLRPISGYEISEGASEFRYGIAPREVTVEWTGASSYVFGDDPALKLTASVDEETSVNWLLESDDMLVSIDGLNAGMHTATATVYTDGKPNGNYKLINGTKVVEITRKPISAKQIVWTAEGASEALDASGNKYYVFANDGLSHVPTAELKVYVGAEEKTIRLTVMGAQSKTGVYTAYAILDGDESYNANFVLVVNESSAELKETTASQKFEISKISISTIDWTKTETAAATEKLTYVYDGKEHKPFATGTTSDGRTIKLTVWGAQINAGEYVAYVTDDYTFEADAVKSAKFAITPKKVKVEWQERDEKNEIHFTYDGTAKRPEVTVGGNLTEDDYFVTGFVNAGSYVSTVVFTNANYTYDNTLSEEANICEFIIDKREISLSWTGAGNYTPSGAEAGVMYWRYNGTARGPVASGSFGNIRFGEDAANRIIVSGREIDAGSYVATATLDSSVAANANYTLTNTTKRYVITPFEIRVIWTGNEDNDGAFEWEYDGDTHHPTAKYKLWNSGEDEWVYVDEKVQGAKTDVGEYIASIALPANCTFEKIGGVSSGEQAFSITKHKVTKIEWYASADKDAEPITDTKDFKFVYNGKSQAPVARVAETGALLIVTGARINAGTGYIATAALKDAGNYELGAGVNATYTFGISAKQITIDWADDSDKGSFTWTYTGSLICPTATFTDVEGNKVAITVTGGKISVGSGTATAHDTFLNYDFAQTEGNLVSRNFEIEAQELKPGDDFEWFANGGVFTPAADGARDTYTFEYNGLVQQPVARCNREGLNIFFAYTITADGKQVGAILNAGTYTLTVKASDVNFVIPVETVTVVIEPMEVEVVWGATSLTHTGVAQVPKAHYVDVNGQSIALSVSSETPVISGSGTATAAFAENDNKLGNYKLAAEEPKAFSVKTKTTATFKWDWATGKFVLVPEEEPETASEQDFATENAALTPSKQTYAPADDRQDA